MQTETLNELEDLTWKLERIFRSEPGLMRKWKPKVRHLEAVATNMARVQDLMKRWPEVPQSFLLEFATEESAPFIKVCIGLDKYKYDVSPVSLFMWWRRMLATGQQHLITYFSWPALERLKVFKVTGYDLLSACTDNIALLNQVNSILADNNSIDFRIRELLGGLSKTSDVRAAWKKWAMINHPDKGGDPEKFLQVKVVYDEWCTLNKNLTQTNKQE